MILIIKSKICPLCSLSLSDLAPDPIFFVDGAEAVHPRYVQVVGLRDLTVVLVWGWVLVNQVVAALMSHHWYRRSFRDYPPQRKAIVPYLL